MNTRTRNRALSTTPAKAPEPVKPEVPVYSPESFVELDIGSLRTKFPAETVGYDDITLFNVAMLPPDDLSDSDWAELLKKHQPEKTVTEMDGEGLSTLAQNFAAQVSPDTEQAMDIAVDGKEDWQGGPITVRAGLRRDFGDKLSGFAEPGSKSGNNPDKYQMPVTDSSGKTAMRKTSFYRQFTRGTPKGKALVERIAYMRRANNMEAVKDGIPQDIIDMSADDRDDDIKAMENRLTNMQTAYVKAMSLEFQCRRFDELICKVDDTGNVNPDATKNTRFKAGSVKWGFIFETDDNGDDTETVKNTPFPIIIEEHAGYTTGTNEPRPVKNRQKVSIGAFLKFKVAVAMQNGSTYKALLKTVERKPKTPAAKATADTRTETVDQFIGRFVESQRFAFEMESAADPKALTKLYDVLKADAKKKDGGELVAAWIEMRNFLDDVAGELQLNAAYVDIAKRLRKIAA